MKKYKAVLKIQKGYNSIEELKTLETDDLQEGLCLLDEYAKKFDEDVIVVVNRDDYEYRVEQHCIDKDKELNKYTIWVKRNSEDKKETLKSIFYLSLEKCKDFCLEYDRMLMGQ